MENEKQVIYLADWLNKTMGNKKGFIIKCHRLNILFYLGLLR